MSRLARFGVFEADLQAGELRKQGRLVRLQPQPFTLLKALLERPNQVVTRDELRHRLWPADVNVDVDRSVNKSVTKLRDALGDSASSPRFIETLPKRGYRFIAQVFFVQNLPEHAVRNLQSFAPVDDGRAVTSWPRLGALLSGMLLALLVAWAYYYYPSDTVRQTSLSSARPAETTLATPVGRNDEAAREAYARGRSALSRRSEEGLRSAANLFERAISIDPEYAAAYVGLADAWSLLSSYGLEESGEAMALSRQFANRALVIDPASAEAHASLGRTAMLAEWNWQVAEWHFQRAIETRQNYPTAHQWYAYLLSATGRHAEAEREARKAAALDPLSLSAATGVGYVLYAARRFTEAAAALHNVIEADPDFMQARKDLGLVLVAQERYAEAIPQFERVVRLSGESAVAQADLAWARGLAGDVPGAQRLLTRIEARQANGYVPLDSMSLAQLSAGQPDRAVATLNAAFKTRVPGVARLAVDPRWDALRDVPQVKAMAETVSAGAR